MNYFYVFIIIVIIILLWYKPSNSLDVDIINGWWYTSEEFNKESGLDYMFINFTPDGDKFSCYIIAGDYSGLLYNTPFKMKLSSANNEKIKVKYNMSVESDEKLPFGENSQLVLDRSNCTVSIFKDNILFAYLNKQC